MIDILRQRRSVRTFLDRCVEQEKIKLLKEALLLSPTSRNLRPWQFYFFENKDMLVKLSSSKASGSALIGGAALAVVIAADETKSDVWIEDCSIASIVLQLQAEALDLGSCWVQIRNRNTADGMSSEDYVRKQLGLTTNMRIESIIAVGYPLCKPPPLGKDKLIYEKIIE